MEKNSKKTNKKIDIKEQYNEIEKLKNIIVYLKSNLNDINLQELSNKCNSINNFCKGDGAGL